MWDLYAWLGAFFIIIALLVVIVFQVKALNPTFLSPFFFGLLCTKVSIFNREFPGTFVSAVVKSEENVWGAI